jgi:endonuclease/exonuclease/phosphatase family metal-dependent hydrolase
MGTPTNPTTPYGPLIETQIRIVTWNLWWRLGDWKTRADAIAETLVELRPDLVCLQEVWQEGDLNQAALLAEQLGMVHAFACDRVEGRIEQGVHCCVAGRLLTSKPDHSPSRPVSTSPTSRSGQWSMGRAGRCSPW